MTEKIFHLAVGTYGGCETGQAGRRLPLTTPAERGLCVFQNYALFANKNRHWEKNVVFENTVWCVVDQVAKEKRTYIPAVLVEILRTDRLVDKADASCLDGPWQASNG